MRRRLDALLVLYDSALLDNAATIREHVRAFDQLSRFPVVAINTRFGFPRKLRELDFGAIVLHYSLFHPTGYRLDGEYRDYLASTDAYKVAFFQDEYHYCRQRFAFLNDFAVDCVYSCLEPSEHGRVYSAHTRVKQVVHSLTGYVHDDLVAAARRFAKPDAARRIDVGYRGRSLPLYMGRGAREKSEIAVEFTRRVAGLGLRLDTAAREEDRLYGDAWYQFLGDCRAVLGVEAGVSIFDIDDVVCPRFVELQRREPSLTEDEIYDRLEMAQWENNIFYRTISPRHFEAAAFRCVQILFEGRYTGLMEPGRHYLPLRKDFSNLDDVVRMFRDPAVRAELTDAAYQDLIVSGRHSYARFIDDFDRRLIDAGVAVGDSAATQRALGALRRQLQRGRLERFVAAHYQWYRYRAFPGRRLLKRLAAPVLVGYRRLRAARG
jgi:hypothetical protein